MPAHELDQRLKAEAWIELHEFNQRLKAEAWIELKVRVEAVFGRSRELGQETTAIVRKSRTLRAKRRFTRRLNKLLPPPVAHIRKKFKVGRAQDCLRSGSVMPVP